MMKLVCEICGELAVVALRDAIDNGEPLLELLEEEHLYCERHKRHSFLYTPSLVQKGFIDPYGDPFIYSWYGRK